MLMINALHIEFNVEHQNDGYHGTTIVSAKLISKSVGFFLEIKS